MPASEESRRDGVTLAAFFGVCLIGGSNIVAVRFSNRELTPFWGAGLRFSLASILLYAIARAMRVPIPRGRDLLGPALFGVVNFAAAFALIYWALKEVPSALGAVVMGSIPLLTFFFALAHRQERFHLRGLIGAVMAAGGIAIMAAAPANADVPILSLLAMIGGAACAAESGIIARHFRQYHPLGFNAVAMPIGAVLLLALSLVAREPWVLPQQKATLLSVGYLIFFGSSAFVLYLFLVKRWTASAASYQFVLFPLVAALLGAWLADESLSIEVALGGVVVLAGVYVGALRSTNKEHR